MSEEDERKAWLLYEHGKCLDMLQIISRQRGWLFTTGLILLASLIIGMRDTLVKLSSLFLRGAGTIAESGKTSIEVVSVTEGTLAFQLFLATIGLLFTIWMIDNILRNKQSILEKHIRKIEDAQFGENIKAITEMLQGLPTFDLPVIIGYRMRFYTTARWCVLGAYIITSIFFVTLSFKYRVHSDVPIAVSNKKNVRIIFTIPKKDVPTMKKRMNNYVLTDRSNSSNL